MEILVIIVGLIVALTWAIVTIKAEELKTRQIEPLKHAIKAAEDHAAEFDKSIIDHDVVGFLNGLHKDNKNTE